MNDINKCLKIYQLFPDISALKVIGDVKKVLNGCVEETCMKEQVLDQLKFALGAGSFSDCSCVGETIVLNQIGYTCHMDTQGSLVINQGTVGLKSPFLMGMDKSCHPSSLLQIDFTTGISLNQVFQIIGKELYAYSFVGCLLFETLACSYLKKPPIFKESINENSEKYWAKTEERLKTYAYVFGVVIKEKEKHYFQKEILESAFYVNPLEKNQGELLSHTHAALVKTPPSFPNLKNDIRFYEVLDPSLVIGARHVFTQSIVKEGLLAIFNINEIDKEGALEIGI